MVLVILQKDYQKFFQESLGGLGEVLKNTRGLNAVTGVDIVTGAKEATGDKYMRAMLGKVKYEQQQLQEMKAAQADETLPAAVRDKAGEQAKVLEAQLADSVGETTQYFAVDAAENVRFEADKAAVYSALGEAAAQISDAQVSGKLQSKAQSFCFCLNIGACWGSATATNWPSPKILAAACCKIFWPSKRKPWVCTWWAAPSR